MNKELYHYGILGMRWGVRRTPEQLGHKPSNLTRMTGKTKSGASITIDEKHTSAFARFLAKRSKKVRDTLEKSKSFKIEAEGVHVGELDLYKESPDSLNVVWVSVDSKHQGKGYGTAVMNAVVSYAKQTNCSQVTLEVPTISPDARHIYEKLGFQATEEIGDEDDAWGGLTKMKLKL